jgi:hypothetical protein
VVSRVASQRFGGITLLAVGSVWRRPTATSDTVLDLFRWAASVGPPTPGFQRTSLTARAYATVGLGRLSEALPLIDSLAAIAPTTAAGALAGPIGLGIAPVSYGAPRLDSLIVTLPRGALLRYGRAFMALSRGDVATGRREVRAGLALGDSIGPTMHGMLIATGGWASLVAGDTAAGVRQLKQGIGQLVGPSTSPMSAFLRFQLALALSARPETREEGLRWLRYAFDEQGETYLVPLTYLALGRTWEASGQRDSALYAYGKFVRLWDKADPPLQSSVREAREAMARLSAEPRAN